MIQIKKYLCVLLAIYATLQISACKNAENKENLSDRQETTADSINKDAVNTISLTTDQYKAINVKTGKIEVRNLSAVVQVNGKLEVPPQNAVSVTVPYGGIVKATTILEGKRVGRGEKLVTLENPEYIQLQQDYLDSKSQLEYLTTEYGRQQELSEQNINAKKTLQKAKADYLVAQTKVNGLKAKLLLLNISATSLDKTGIQNTVSVFSPINGYVTQVNVNRGTYVNPNDMMFRIINTDNTYVELKVFEKDISKLKLGQVVRFELSNDTVSHAAKIYLIGKEIDKDGSIPVNCRIEGKSDPRLIPGMYVKATIESGSKKVSALPEESIVNFQDKNYIFIPVKEGAEKNSNYSFRMIEIETGTTENGFTEVMLPADLKADQLVVFQGAYDLLSKAKNSAEEE